MPTRPALNRADLLACLQAYGEAHIEACASVLGYVRRAPAPPMPSPPPPPQEREAVPSVPAATRPVAVSHVRAEAETEPSTPTAAKPTLVPRVRFPRVVAQRQLEPTEAQRDEPPWYCDAVPMCPDDPILCAKPHAPPPPTAPPLMPWARLWPVLKNALSTQIATAVPDIPRLVEALARGQFLRRARPACSAAGAGSPTAGTRALRGATPSPCASASTAGVPPGPRSSPGQVSAGGASGEPVGGRPDSRSGA